MATHPSLSSHPHELLTCGICEELYDDWTHQAKFLACFHTFCSYCLTKLANTAQVNQVTIQCPNCRSLTLVPAKGIDGLQTNFYITGIKEISQTNEQPKAMGRNMKPCKRHPEQSKSYYCVTCGIFLCPNCEVMAHTAMAGHSIITISDTETSYLQEIKVSRKSLAQNERHIQLLESEMALLTAAKDTTMKDMEAFIKLAQEQLEQRRNDLEHLILDQFKAKQKDLLDKQKQIQGIIETLNRDITHAENITKTGNLTKLRSISESLKDVNEKTQAISSRPNLGENCLEFDTNEGLDEFRKSLCTLGQIKTKGFVRMMIAPRSSNVTAGLKTTLTVEAYNHQGDKVPVSSRSLSVQVTDPTDTELFTAICSTDSECTVTFIPQQSGMHQIVGKFPGQQQWEQIQVLVSSNNPVGKFGETGHGNGTFNLPYGITADNNNCLYVADVNNRLIQKFTAQGEFLSQFSVAIHNKDFTTMDMALDLTRGLLFCMETLDEGDMLTEGNSLLVFNLSGQLQHRHTPEYDLDAHYIAINKRQEIFMSDVTKKCLVKEDRENKFVCHIGDFKSPGYIAINNDDSIIVSDKDNDCIYIFNPNGTIRNKFGSSGTGKGELKEPYGVTTDGEYILVSEQGNNRVQVFLLDGTFVSMIESQDDPLKYPAGLVVTKDGYVYVADRCNDCIKKYKYK